MKTFKEIREKFKVKTFKGQPRITDIYVQFRGGKGDRITSPENKRDFTSAVKMTLQFLKKNKLKSKPVFSTPEEGSSAYKVSLILNKQEEKTADLTPLANALAVLKTSEDHGMAWAKPVGESVNEKYRSKFPAELVAAAVKIALDMAGAMTPAVKKIEAMKRGLSNDPMVKDALRMANESVNEKMSAADKKKRLEMIRKAVEKLNAKQDAQAKKDALAAIKAMSEWVEETNEGTMAIGIKDRDPKERAKAIAKLKSMLKKDGNKKVGSQDGKKFDYVLDMEVLSDDELADEFANPKNKNIKIKDLLKKHSKRLNVKFVEEAASLNKVMKVIQKDLKKERIRSMDDLDTYLDYSGGDIIFDMESDEDKANDLINKVRDKLKKQFRLK